MEGIYFFGEYQRWNLGWSNPNQAGVFVAMWIPWLWALGAWAETWNEEGARRSWHGLLPRDATATIMMGAGSSWLVLLIANVFSTLRVSC